MLALSGALHLVLAVLALAFPPLFGTPMRLEPVAVVDLIGGGEFRGDAGKPPGPPPREVRAKTQPAGKIPPREKRPARGKTAGAAREEKPSPDAFPTSKRRAAAALQERLRRMREAREGAESVREAVEQRRREAAARAAVRGVGERVAHRIEAPSPPRRGAEGHGTGGGGSRGSVRVSPELVDYFRRLEEAVRSAWILPEALSRGAGNLVVELRIVIEKDGRVSEALIERGSGNLYFDDSVQRAIRKASPLPIPPEQLRGGEDHYEVGFRFHGAGGGAG